MKKLLFLILLPLLLYGCATNPVYKSDMDLKALDKAAVLSKTENISFGNFFNAYP